MFDKMKQLMEVKRQAERIKKELDAMQVEVSEIEGIKITINGSQDFKSFEIDEQILNSGDKQKIEADILRSVNAAIVQSQQLAAQKMKDVMPGLPGL